jgi:hypothetical protein
MVLLLELRKYDGAGRELSLSSLLPHTPVYLGAQRRHNKEVEKTETYGKARPQQDAAEKSAEKGLDCRRKVHSWP